MKALQSMDYHATSNKLAKHIAACTNQREEDILDTVKRVLSTAVTNGFLVTRGRSYQLPGTTIQMDSRKRLNPRRSSTGNKITKSNSRQNSSRKTVRSKAAPKTASKTNRVNKSKLKARK